MKSFKMIKSHSTLSLSIALNISAVIPDGPGALLFFICSSACSISFRVISCSGPSVVFSSSLAFSLLSSSSKYDFHLSLIASSSVKILPLLSLIMFTACLSILFLCLVFAILYIFASPSFVLSSSYRWCTEMCFAFATLFLVSLLVILYAFLRSASSRFACHLLNASFLFLTANCTFSDHHHESRSGLFWPLVTPHIFIAVLSMLVFSFSQVISFVSCISFSISCLKFSVLSPFNFQVLIRSPCFTFFCSCWGLICILITKTLCRLTAASPGIPCNLSLSSYLLA